MIYRSTRTPQGDSGGDIKTWFVLQFPDLHVHVQCVQREAPLAVADQAELRGDLPARGLN